MSDWGNIVEDRIQEALERGDFDNLPGHGKPLKLDDNPHAEQGAWAAHHLLKTNGYTLPWIEERRDIDAGVATAMTALRRAYNSLRGGLSRTPPDAWAASRWQFAIDTFAERTRSLNRRIRDHNLRVSHTAFHCPPLDVEREVNRLIEGRR